MSCAIYVESVQECSCAHLTDYYHMPLPTHHSDNFFLFCFWIHTATVARQVHQERTQMDTPSFSIIGPWIEWWYGCDFSGPFWRNVRGNVSCCFWKKWSKLFISLMPSDRPHHHYSSPVLVSSFPLYRDFSKGLTLIACLLRGPQISVIEIPFRECRQGISNVSNVSVHADKIQSSWFNRTLLGLRTPVGIEQIHCFSSLPVAECYGVFNTCAMTSLVRIVYIAFHMIFLRIEAEGFTGSACTTSITVSINCDTRCGYHKIYATLVVYIQRHFLVRRMHVHMCTKFTMRFFHLNLILSVKD